MRRRGSPLARFIPGAGAAPHPWPQSEVGASAAMDVPCERFGTNAGRGFLPPQSSSVHSADTRPETAGALPWPVNAQDA